MDTGNIMQNQMDALIEQGIQLQKEICDQAEFIHKNQNLSPAELLKQRDELLKALENVRKWYEENHEKYLGEYTPVVFSEALSVIQKTKNR